MIFRSSDTRCRPFSSTSGAQTATRRRTRCAASGLSRSIRAIAFTGGWHIPDGMTSPGVIGSPLLSRITGHPR
jgi:hypothetical protein